MKRLDSKQKNRKTRVSQKAISSKRLRLSVFCSGKYTYGQIIDDDKKETLVFASDKSLAGADQGGKKLTKIEKARLVGEALAKKAEKKKIDEVVFDRSYFRYHGRVKALAEGARQAGLKF